MAVKNKPKTIQVPASILKKLEELSEELERWRSPYRPEFLSAMRRARAQDLRGEGKPIEEVVKKYKSK